MRKYVFAVLGLVLLAVTVLAATPKRQPSLPYGEAAYGAWEEFYASDVVDATTWTVDSGATETSVVQGIYPNCLLKSQFRVADANDTADVYLQESLDGTNFHTIDSLQTVVNALQYKDWLVGSVSGDTHDKNPVVAPYVRFSVTLRASSGGAATVTGLTIIAPN